jgi:hypothetical protein
MQRLQCNRIIPLAALQRLQYNRIIPLAALQRLQYNRIIPLAALQRPRYFLLLLKQVQRFSGSAVQRFNGSTVQRFNGSTVQRFSGSTVQRFGGKRVQEEDIQRFIKQSYRGQSDSKNGDWTPLCPEPEPLDLIIFNFFKILWNFFLCALSYIIGPKKPGRDSKLP